MTAILAQAKVDLPDVRQVVGFAGWQDFVQSASATAKAPGVRPDDAVQTQYTSGTTGFPKGAILHHRGIVNASRFMAEGTGLERAGVWVNAMPMFHIGGCGLAAVGTFSQHGKHVLVPRFDAALVLELIESEQRTFMLTRPASLSHVLIHR